MFLKRNSKLIQLFILATTGAIGITLLPVESFSSAEELSPLLTVEDNNKSAPNSNDNANIINESNQQYKESDLYPIENPNLLNINGPEVTLIFKKTQAKEIFEYMATLGNYGFVWVKNNPTDESPIDGERLITLTLNNVSYKRAFNALLLASGLQAKLYNNVLYVGPNVRSTVFTSRSTGVYQLNQISASSAADYLANLGASVTKTYTIKTSVTQGASQSEAVQGSSTSATTTDQSETSVKVYGATIGPLVGLIATTDERLRTVTMVGEKSLIDLASVFLERLDKKQKQVALSVRVLDVNLSDTDSFTQSWGSSFAKGSPFIIGEGGIIKSAMGRYIPKFGEPEENPGRSYATSGNDDFFALLQASIVKGSTKVLASPTLLLSESSGAAGDGKDIGRKFGNEGLVVVGDNVPVSATYSEGACTYSYDLVGVKLGAKVLGIDQNKYITFTMTPVVSGISSTLNITGCGPVSILNARKVDTGAVRIKDGETLVLTGVIQDSDVEKIYKYPILGDLPLLGSLFRSRTNEVKKRELIVLVTPKIVNDSDTNIEKSFNLEFSDDDSKKLMKKLK